MKRFLAILVLGLGGLAQTGRDIPTCQGPDCIDDVTHQERRGQPLWCQNFEGGGYVHNCDCQQEACKPDGKQGGGSMSHCKVYCRKKACRCVRPCMTKMRSLDRTKTHDTL